MKQKVDCRLIIIIEIKYCVSCCVYLTRIFFGECLATIKGVSGEMALAITGKWSTLNDFIKDSEWETTLKEEIKYKTAKGNDKHISDKVIEKIRLNFGLSI